MMNKHTPLNLTADELATIEAALNTQVKILNMQAGAGLPHALTQLNQVKRVLARLGRQKPRKRTIPLFFKQSWQCKPCLFC